MSKQKDCGCCGPASTVVEGAALQFALVGTPNCGKTALFNALTGSRQKVANYAGVTVERKEGRMILPDGRKVALVDLPGTMSLRARSPDEEVTRDIVLGRRDEQRPDVLVCVGDATHLRPTLRLLIELRQTGLPVVLAVNMMDIARARHRAIDLERLSALLGIPVVSSVAVRTGGTQALLDRLALCQRTAPVDSTWVEPDPAQLRAWNGEADRILKEITLATGDPAIATTRLDRVLLHPVGGLVLLFAVLFLLFQAVFVGAAPFQDWIDGGFKALGEAVSGWMGEGLLRSLLVDGVLAGVGSVLVFLPQIIILFMGIILLEDFGYMARAAFLLDRLMGGVGLHGRAFIPLLSSFACAIPGIMATRTIENPRARLATILIAPLMTCSARLPVYALIIGAMIPDQTVAGFASLQGLVMFGLYAVGITGGLIVAFVLKHTFLRHAMEPLLIELPDFKRPSWKNIYHGVGARAFMFVKRAGTIIFALSLVLWFLSSFPTPPEGSTQPAITTSFAGQLGQFLAPVMAPLGFNWQMTLALIPAFGAREVAVAALGTIYAVGGEGDAVTQSLASMLQASWSLPSALAFLVWFVFAPQCLSTLAVVRRETHSWFWPVLMFVYMTALAYVAAFATYRLAL